MLTLRDLDKLRYVAVRFHDARGEQILRASGLPVWKFGEIYRICPSQKRTLNENGVEYEIIPQRTESLNHVRTK